MATLDPDQMELRTAYIGDSGYFIFKPRIANGRLTFDLVFESEEQQKSFNFPYQIGTKGDKPSVAIEHLHQVSPGDLIILATDGVTDNLDAAQIRDILQKETEGVQEIDVSRLAEAIGNSAFGYSLQR